MNTKTEVFSIPCRKFTGNSGEVPACPSDCPCDGRPQFVGQHSAVTDTGSTAHAIEPPVLSTVELSLLNQRCLAAEEGDREAQKELEYFSPLVLAGIINELIESRKQLRKVALTLPNDSQPEPVQWLEGQPIDLSRIQRAVIQPGANGLNMALAQVSGVESIFPYNEQVLKDWATIRRAQVWGKK